ncbi:MAG TPA: HAMP domain-containing sensor histidine kinase [Chitinophagaceae bacterium]
MKSIVRLSSDKHKPYMTTKQRDILSSEPNANNESEKVSSLESLIKMIVHEIRNPLTSIDLANQLMHEELNNGATTASLNVYHDLIAKNVSRVEELLKDLLFESPLQELEFTATNIRHVIETSLEKAGDRIFLKKLEVMRDYDQDILIDGNAEKLSVAFLNIIVNAIEATKMGEGKIWITAYRVRDAVKIVITDNGVGMEPEVTSHMFDKNFSCKSKGSGVGLTHVKEILEWHDAKVSVISEPGTGTSVIIAFKAVNCN